MSQQALTIVIFGLVAPHFELWGLLTAKEDCAKEGRELHFVAVAPEGFEQSPGLVDLIEHTEYVDFTTDEIGQKLFNEESLYRSVSHIKENYSDKKLLFISINEANIAAVEGVVSSLFEDTMWNHKTAELCRDKIYMKQYLSGEGIRVPKYQLLNHKDNFSELSKLFGLPFVMKPNLGYGSKGFAIIQSEKEYLDYMSEVDDPENYEVEEYLDGKLFHMDTVSVGNEIYVSISEYAYPMAEYKQQKPMASLLLPKDHPLYEKLYDFNWAVIKAINNVGSFHNEVFVKPDGEVVFLEIAWRQAGLATNFSFLNVYDIDQSALFLRKLLHLEYHLPKKITYNFKVYVIKRAGMFNGISMPKILSDTRVELLQKVGTEMSKPLYCADACAIIEVFSDNYEEARADFETLKNADYF